MLAAEEHLALWDERNRQHGEQISAECDRGKMPHDAAASRQIAVWAYGQAEEAGGLGWVLGKRYAAITGRWREVLVLAAE